MPGDENDAAKVHVLPLEGTVGERVGRLLQYLRSEAVSEEALLSLLAQETISSRDEAMALEKAASRIAIEDTATRNFASLLDLVVRRCRQAQNEAFSGDLSPLANGIVVCIVVLRSWFEALDSDHLRTRFESLGSAATEGQNHISGKELLLSLMDLVIEVPLGTAQQCKLVSEATCALIILCSSQLKSEKPDAASDYILSMVVSPNALIGRDRAKPLQRRLLQLFVTSAKPQPSPGLLGSAFSMFFGSPSAALDPQAAAALGERAIILLLILAFQQKDEESPNPFRDELASWAVDEEAPSFVEVYSVLCRAIESNEETSLLLYLLLYLNEQFRSFLLSTSEPEALLLPLAKTLYSTISLNPSYSHLYMLLIILLLFSQDDVFAGRCYQITIQPPLWLKERPAFKTLSLGDFLVLVLMKILLTNLSSGRDLFFHSNCVAALANFARLSVNMHPYVAQKLVGLIETVGRRWGRAEESAPEKAIYEDLLSVLLEIINAVLATNLHQNRDLVHAVLLRHELFLQYRSHPRLADLVDNISIVSKYFMAKVDDATLKITSAGEVLALIDAWSKQWSPRTLKAFPELRFQYEAKAESSAFCLPYVWSLAYRVIVGVEWPPDAALTRTFLEEHGIGTVGLV